MVDLKKMMQQAQQMQDTMQAELAEVRVSAAAGGGVVTATLNGQKELINLEIDAAVVDPDDVEMLQDLVVAAVNEASRRVDEEVQRKLGNMMPAGLSGMLG
jgi:DNA-binding YbaB/EbfC family protein